MGLLTGFSILSGVEIVYFVLRFSLNFFDNLLWLSFLRFFMSLKIPRAAVVSVVKKRFENHLTRRE